MKHIHADAIKAWADGAQIQVKCTDGWYDITDPPWYTGREYRVRSVEKKKVKMWQWVYKDNNEFRITSHFFKDEEQAMASLYPNVQFPALWTEIEIEE